ncbi:TnsD family Tn7-like transposition protein [Rummeliibacillus suwonensis]|uniref:TnsD family Tn7-like transposition protein n=1 Tax=Rummeliibacillus suwonensis TaxID=1306154 RepID=UPI001AAF707F|nr:hypothetical protein [Rummeliibacillus suwonensis]
MAKRKRNNSSKNKIEKWIKEGRGQGEGENYKPWLEIQDVASNGYATRNLGWKTKRKHHFLSDLELQYFYTLEWSPLILDIRRYCLHCYLEEMNLYGEAYWHKSHQLPGIYVCPKHKELLWISNIEYRNKPNKHSFIPLEQSCVENGQEVSISEEFFPNLVFIAEQSHELLNSRSTLIGLENINNFYITKLNEKNYITPSKRIRFQELIPDFIHYFPRNFLQFLNSDFNYFDQDTWFHKVLRKPRVVCHPLRHLLMLSFLGQNVFNQLQKVQHKVNFFGQAPWPCLNRAADHYKELILTECIISRDSKSGKPVGTFTCKDCGFSYSRTGPDVLEEDKYRIGRIKKFGPIWENKLHTLHSSQGYSIRSISSKLGADPKTIKKYLSNYSKNLSIASNRKHEYSIQEKRRRFIKLRKDSPTHSRTELRKSSPRLYNWLFQNDKEWLISNLPSIKRRGYTRKSDIDWKKRDDEYLPLIIREAMDLSLEVPLVRVTKTKIYQRLDIQARFESNIEKLPKCEKLIQNLTETVEEFQIRRIRYFGEKFRNKNIDYSVSSLKRASGIKQNSNKLIQYIILNEMNKQGE